MRSPERLRAEFERLHGHWDEQLQALLDLDPRLFAVHAGLVGVAERNGALPAEIRHLVHLAVKDTFTRNRGFWHEDFEQLLRPTGGSRSTPSPRACSRPTSARPTPPPRR